MMYAKAPTKSYEICFEHRADYLYVYVKDDHMTYESAKQCWNEILAIQHRKRYNKVLIDKDIARPLPIYFVVTLVSELAHSGCAGVKFAIADRHYDAERNPFEETVAANRGLNVKICPSLPEAEAWLVDNDSLANYPIERRPDREAMQGQPFEQVRGRAKLQPGGDVR